MVVAVEHHGGADSLQHRKKSWLLRNNKNSNIFQLHNLVVQYLFPLQIVVAAGESGYAVSLQHMKKELLGWNNSDTNTLLFTTLWRSSSVRSKWLLLLDIMVVLSLCNTEKKVDYCGTTKTPTFSNCITWWCNTCIPSKLWLLLGILVVLYRCNTWKKND